MDAVPFIDVQAGVYASSYTSAQALAPSKRGDGSYELTLPFDPETLIPVIDMVSDYGLFVREAIESQAFGGGLEIFAGGELLSVGDMFKQLSENLLKSTCLTSLNVTDRFYISHWEKSGFPSGQR
jgi:hypothetical protein